MKILMISDVYFPRVNGVSTSIATFRSEMEARGHEVHLIAPDYGKVTDNEERIYRIPSRQLPLDPEDRMMKGGDILAMREELRLAKFDIIHIQTPFVAHYLGVRLAKELRLPRVESYHTFFEEYLYHYIPFLPRGLLRLLARRFSSRQCNALDGLVVPSTAMLEVLRNYGIKTHAEIIPTGLEAASFEPGDGPSFRRRHGIPAQRPVMTYIGRVAFEKNIGFLLQVTAHLKQGIPDVLLVIAGEGPALEHLRNEAQKLGIGDHVLFVGYLDRRRELPDCYRASDVFVFSSRTETQGLVLLEAMAQGVPVVSIAVMGAKDVLKQGQGVLITEQEPDEFAAKVYSLLNDKDAAVRLGKLGVGYAALWSAGTLSEKKLDFYQHIIGLHRQASAAAPDWRKQTCLNED